MTASARRHSSSLRALLLLLGFCLVGHEAAAAPPVFESPLPLDDTPLEYEWDNTKPALGGTGAGTWIVAWESGDSLGGTIGHDGDILFARSTDHGLSFSPPAALNSTAAADTPHSPAGIPVQGLARDQIPALAADGNGNWMAVWKLLTLGADLIMLARSTDDGASWGPATVVYDSGDEPRVATDGAGTWIVTWTDGVSYQADKEIYMTRSADGGTTWSTPSPLNTDAAGVDADDVGAVVRFGGTAWIAVWTKGKPTNDPNGSHVRVARSTDGGVTWSAPTTLDVVVPDDDDPDWFPDLATNGAGQWVAVWMRRNPFFWPLPSNELMVARSADDGLTWTPPTPHDPAPDGTTRNYWPHIAAGAPGTYLVVWSHDPTDCMIAGAGTDVFMSYSDDGGATWSPPAPLHADTPAFDPLDQYATAAWNVDHWIAVWARNALSGKCGGGPMTVRIALAGQSCGNGTLDAGEACDGGDRAVADCCSRTCQLDGAGTPCTPDPDLCSFDRCDDVGVCHHVLEPATSCSAPSAPTKSTFKVKAGSSPEKQALRWKWRGQELNYRQLGNPTTDTAYALCVYDGSTLVSRADAPAGGLCGPKLKPCWTAKNGYGYYGYSYRDQDRSPNGVSALALTPGVDGKASIQLKASGSSLVPPALPITSLPVTVQLSSSNGACWQARYDADGTGRNSATGFSAVSE